MAAAGARGAVRRSGLTDLRRFLRRLGPRRIRQLVRLPRPGVHPTDRAGAGLVLPPPRGPGSRRRPGNCPTTTPLAKIPTADWVADVAFLQLLLFAFDVMHCSAKDPVDFLLRDPLFPEQIRRRSDEELIEVDRVGIQFPLERLDRSREDPGQQGCSQLLDYRPNLLS
jgi:hypothetical protein